MRISSYCPLFFWYNFYNIFFYFQNQKVKIDFGRWKDEDESEDEQGGGAGYDDANLEDMMRQMGTGGEDDGFDPGEGPDSEDSDDEGELTPPFRNDISPSLFICEIWFYLFFYFTIFLFNEMIVVGKGYKISN